MGLLFGSVGTHIYPESGQIPHLMLAKSDKTYNELQHQITRSYMEGTDRMFHITNERASYDWGYFAEFGDFYLNHLWISPQDSIKPGLHTFVTITRRCF